MLFHYNQVEILKDNPLVQYVDYRILRLVPDFKVKLFRLWKDDDLDGIVNELERNGLGSDITSTGFLDDLLTAFKNGGYPLCRRGEVSTLAWENPLLTSGKFIWHENKNGMVINPDFERKLWAGYPEVSVEENIARAGLDLRDMGYQRIRNLKISFEKKLREESPDHKERGSKRKAIEPSAPVTSAWIPEMVAHPYVRRAESRSVVLLDAFYNEAYLLDALGIEIILEVFELPEQWFDNRGKGMIISRLKQWVPTSDRIDGAAEQTLRISRNREAAMAQLVAETFENIRRMMPEMKTEERRKLAEWIHTLPRDPWRVYTTGRILRKIGLSKSTYYELLNNENYGKAGERRLARDEEDILLIKKVADYRGYTKGYRQISMMMESVTGRTMSEHRVLYLMRKYGIRTNIRRPSKNRKAMKELMRRNGKENLLMRRFKLHRPNEVRLTDVTYLDYGGGQRAYGSASIDPVTNRLICFVISEKNDLQLALDTLEAMDACPVVNGGIIHSDQGILYFTDDFQSAVKEKNLVQSMSRRGNCWDNAVCESFFGHFKDESGYAGCKTFEELREKVRDYGLYYNEERRIHSHGKMTPVEYEEYLDAMDPDAFAAYMAEEEKKYLKKKEEAAARAAERARERREAAKARLGEIADETC